jgi:hypothetical protein
MCQLTLTDIRKDDARGLDRRVLADIRANVLDFRLRVIPVEQHSHVLEDRDLGAVDYVDEFGAFLDSQQLDPASAEFISKKGREVLQRVIEGHREEKDAAA